MLTDSPVVRAASPRILFLSCAAITAALLLWMHQLRLEGEIPGLTTIFFVLFAHEDYGAAACELLILVAAVFIASRIPVRKLLRGVGERPATVAAITAVVLCAGALGVYHDHPLSMDEYAAYFQGQIFASGHLAGQFPVAVKDWLIPPDAVAVFSEAGAAIVPLSADVEPPIIPQPPSSIIPEPATIPGITHARISIRINVLILNPGN